MKKIFGFSLVEIVVALIIFSVITAALAPIITKKLKSNNVTVGSLGGGSSNTNCDAFGPNCSFCTSDTCVVCGLSCLESQALDIPGCSCKECVELHGDKCLKCGLDKCIKCIGGYYTLDNNCTQCPIGSYCDGTYKKTCKNGEYSDVVGLDECKDCEKGYYCTGGIKGECPAGKYSESKSSSCTNCPIGYYCPGASDKILCSGNKYQPNEGKNSCLTCNAGSYVSNDRTQCLTCGIGFKCPGDGTMVACSTGTYQPYTGQSSCLTCPSGSVCSGATVTQCQKGTYATSTSSVCEQCPKGYYCTGGSNITKCADGTYNDLVGQSSSSACKSCTSVVANCKSCLLTTGQCSACNDGYELKNGVCEQGSNEFKFSFNNAFIEEKTDQKHKIYLKATGTFRALSDASGTVFVVGGGGGGGSSTQGGGGGGGGRTMKSSFTFVRNTDYSVTIGGTSGTSWFSYIQAAGGGSGTDSGGGGGGTGNGGSKGQAGENGVTFDGEWFGGGGGGGSNGWAPPGGNGGAGAGGWDGRGQDGVDNTGGGGGGSSLNRGATAGGSGVVVIVITK